MTRDLFDLRPGGSELTVDLFAGGGGASEGIRWATGREPDVAINHDPAAVSMHKQNHPTTRHYVQDVFTVDPREATQGRPVGLLWASPDCTDHSKAKGAAPIRDRKRRALAWVVTRWAGQVRPRVIMLENVEEFEAWGPLIGSPGELRRDPAREGRTFRRWVRSLRDLGYVVEWRCLRASDFGAPTSRRRLFLVARCDGLPIEWPAPTHGPGRPAPYRTAAECIDFSEPMCSIFATKTEARAWGREHGRHAPRRPLVSATLRRIAHGVVRYVVEAETPFVVDGVAPFFVPRYGERKGQAPRTRSVDRPHPVVVPTGNGAGLVAVFLARHYGGMVAKDIREPLPTITTTASQDQPVCVRLEPAAGELAGGVRVLSFLSKYYGQGVGQSLADPLATIRTKDTFGLVTVTVAGAPYVIVDIAMRMLTPRELYNAQGFPPEYVISHGAPLTADEQLGLHLDGSQGRPFTKTDQLRMVGNSVSPQMSQALALANLPAMAARVA